MTLRTGGRQPPEAPRARLTASPPEILTRAPLRQALGQMEPGWDAERGPWLVGYHAPDPLPMTAALGHGERDFTGLRVDRLRVIGRVDRTHPASGPYFGWMVRCDCGAYETRCARALGGRMRSDRAMCQRCDYARHMLRRAYFDRHGRWPADDYGRETPPTLDLRAVAQTLPVNGAPPPDPNDKGNRGKGDRSAQRRRAKARKRWEGRR